MKMYDGAYLDTAISFYTQEIGSHAGQHRPSALSAPMCSEIVPVLDCPLQFYTSQIVSFISPIASVAEGVSSLLV